MIFRSRGEEPVPFFTPSLSPRVCSQAVEASYFGRKSSAVVKLERIASASDFGKGSKK